MDRIIRLASIRTCKHAWRLPASTSRWNLRGQKGGGYVQPYGQFRIFMSHNENSLRATSCAQFLSSYAKAPEYYFQAGPYSSQRRHRAIEMFQKAKSGLYCGPRSLLLSENFILQPQNPWDISYTKRRKSVHETTHTVCTIDCIPYNDFKHFEVAVIDEVHLIDDPVRGHAWVKAIQELNADQIYICGEATAISIVERLVASRGGQLQVKNYEQQTKFSLQKKPLCSYRNAKEGDCIVCCDKNRALEIAAEIEQYNLATAVKYDTLPNRLKLAQLQSFNDERGQAKVLVCTDVMEAGYNIKANRFILDDMRLFKSCYNDAEISRLVHHIKGRAKTIKYSKLTNELACRSREDLLFVADILKVHPHMIAEVPGREQQDNEHHNDDHLTTQQLVQGHDLTQKIEASCDMTEKLELAEKWFSELEKMPKHERGSTEALTELEHLHQQTDHFLRLFESSPMDAARLQKVQNLQEHITRKINMTLEVILRPQKGLDITLYEADYVDISIKAKNIKHNSLLASDTVNEESHVCISDETQIIEHSSLLASDTVNEESYVCISDETQIFEHSSLLASDTANEESHVCISDETQNIEHSSLLASDTVSEKIGAFTSGDMKYTGEYISIFDSLSTNAVEKDITPKQQIKSGESVQIDTENAAPSPASGLPHPKNALQLLNDLKPGIRYHVISQEGPVHDPSFTMGVEMNGQIFEGKGPTKNKARRKAAEQALYSLGQDLHSDTTAHASSTKKAEGDFTGDDTKENIENQAASMDTSADVTVGMKRGGDPPCAGENKMRKTGGAGGPSQTKNALKLLNQRDFSYRVIAIEGPVHHPSYTIALEVNGQMFEGKGSSKSLARRKAFEQALYTLSQELHSVSTAHASSIKKAEGDFIGDDTEGDIETTENIENQAASMDTSADVTVGMKRGGDPPCAGENKMRKTGGAGGPSQTKNALKLLNQRDFSYRVIAIEGPVHHPSYTIALEVNGQMFEGKGSSKSLARRKAFEQALYTLSQELHSVSTAHASSIKKAEGDFIGDDTEGDIETTENIENQAASMDTSADVTVGMKRGGDPPCAGENKMRKTGGAGGPSQTKNALKLLNQRDFSYRVIAIEGPVHHPSYTIALEVNGQMFEGKGSSKSLARRKAFEQALYTLSQELHSVSTAHASSIKKAEGDFIGDDTEGDIETTGGTHVKSSESTRVSRIFHEGFHDEMPISQNESHPNHIPNPHDKPITGGINSLLNFWKKLSKTMSKISLKGSINSNKTQAQGVNGKALPWNDRAAGSLDQEQASTSHDRAATASENACALTWNDVASTWNERAIKKSSKSDNHGLEEAEEENSEYGHLLGKRASRKESTSTGNRSSFADMLSNKIETVKVRKNARKAYSHETLRMLNFNEMRTKSEKTRAAKPYKPFKNVKQGRTRVLIQPETTFESERYEGVNKAVSIKTSKMKAAYEQSNVEFFESFGDSGKTPVSIKKPHTLDENPSDFADCSIVEEKSENATSIESFKTVPRNSSQTLGKEAFLSESVKVESEARQKSAPKSYKNPHWFED